LAGYKKVTKEDAEIFLKLYEKYLLMKLDDMKTSLKPFQQMLLKDALMVLNSLIRTLMFQS